MRNESKCNLKGRDELIGFFFINLRLSKTLNRILTTELTNLRPLSLLSMAGSISVRDNTINYFL